MSSEIFTILQSQSPETRLGGPLAGLRVVIQPNLSVCGWPTTAGSLGLEGFVALEDATVVTLLRQAGAVIVGSALMSELGFGLAGDTVTQALTEGYADVGLMTDTMGEARLAAAKAGLFAFKPSYGIVSRLGLIGLVPSMECVGIVARDPRHFPAVMSAIAQKDPDDFSMTEEALPDFRMPSSFQGKGTRIGVVEEYVETLSQDEAEAFAKVLASMERAGFAVNKVRFDGINLFPVVHNIVGSVEASSSAGKYDGVRYGHRTSSARNWNEMYLKSRGESFGTLIKTYLFQGAYFQFEAYADFENACRIRRRLVGQVNTLLEEVDCLASLTSGTDYDPYRAVNTTETYDAFASTLMASVTGQPSLQLPGLAMSGNRDLGLQLIGPRLGDPQLLAMAAGLSRLVEGV
jgi:aspartyl-tRNA(Asn)/glutamyl-tRNA(Gln) amidotransferase subunit A